MHRPDPALEETEGAPQGEFDPHAAEDSVLDEILQYASGKQASGLKDKYFPAPPAGEPDGDEAIPGVEAEGESDEAAPTGDAEITPEQIALLEQLLQQSA